MSNSNREKSISSSGVGILHRAIVSMPQSPSSRTYAERVVFFEAPNRAQAAGHLEKLLSIVWGMDTTDWCSVGNIYNVDAKDELEQNCYSEKADDDNLYLFEIGCGGSNGIGPNHIHYARATDVDFFVTPRHAQCLQHAVWIIEALYGDQDAADLLDRIRAKQ